MFFREIPSGLHLSCVWNACGHEEAVGVVHHEYKPFSPKPMCSKHYDACMKLEESIAQKNG